MRMPRNAAVPSPDRDGILSGELALDAAGKPYAVQAWAYRGTEPVRNINRVSEGALLGFQNGLAFLTTGKKLLSVGTFADVALGHAGESLLGLLPTLAVKVGLGMSESKAAAEFWESLRHPDSFVIPYVDVVEATYQRVGSRLTGRREDAIVTRQPPAGPAESYCLTPFNQEFVESLVTQRFLAERRAIIDGLLAEHGDGAAIARAVAEDYHRRHGDQVAGQFAAIKAEVQRRIEERLAQTGLTRAGIEAQALERLAAWRGVPQAAPYFERKG
jgi:hypothetical protein